MTRAIRIAVIALAAFALLQWWSGERQQIPGTAVDAGSHAGLPADQTTGTRYPAFLPAEAVVTLQAIARGGPFPYARDGVEFQNREHRLPERPRGYYHEYTVPTPESGDRGSRRIIAGGDPPEVYYYTDDHYQSFRDVEINP
jgi:ribonuclease T1